MDVPLVESELTGVLAEGLVKGRMANADAESPPFPLHPVGALLLDADLELTVELVCFYKAFPQYGLWKCCITSGQVVQLVTTSEPLLGRDPLWKLHRKIHAWMVLFDGPSRICKFCNARRSLLPISISKLSKTYPPWELAPKAIKVCLQATLWRTEIRPERF